ncbi:MAG: discoidin domain-containing protein, partial [Gemmataceae bacterium]|nr:discoidin domain-containing protein [Gemmataceae bacterium]
LVGGADVGAPPVAGETEYAPATGVVTVRGGGAGIAGRADQFHLASVPAAGDQALVARVTAVGNTSRGAQAGVMFRDGATATARFAAAVVTPGNGVRFLWRSAAGGPVAETGVDGVAAPVWLKLVRAGDTYSAYYAATAGTPGAADWVAVGSPRAMTFAAATYRAGLAVSSLDRANRLTATFTDVSLTAGAGVRLAGTVIGTAGSRDGAGRTRDKAFDGNLATYFDAPAAAGGWVGLDLGAARAISQIRFAPRAYASVRMVGGVFQASNTADFSSGVVTLHTVGAAPVEGARTAVAVAPAGQYRYVRYLAPALSWGNIAEFEVYGPAT